MFQSIKTQNISNYDVIIIGNDSTYLCQSIIDDCVRKNLKFCIYTIKNNMGGAARNYGLKLALGKQEPHVRLLV